MDIQQSANGKLRELALFAGAGGGILGGKLLGWQTVCAVERDAYAAQILAQRQNDGILETFPIWSDVCSFDGKPWRGIVDVVSGGFPCQPHSSAGTKKGTEDHRWLWDDIERIIIEVEPEYVYLENVPGVISNGALLEIVQRLDEIGFSVTWEILSAGKLGAEHERERIWILAHSNSSQFERRSISSRVHQKNALVSNSRWGKDKPGVDRASNGVAWQMDRLKAIGNGQVPIVAATAFELLRERLENA